MDSNEHKKKKMKEITVFSIRAYQVNRRRLSRMSSNSNGIKNYNHANWSHITQEYVFVNLLTILVIQFLCDMLESALKIVSCTLTVHRVCKQSSRVAINSVFGLCFGIRIGLTPWCSFISFPCVSFYVFMLTDLPSSVSWLPFISNTDNIRDKRQRKSTAFCFH